MYHYSLELCCFVLGRWKSHLYHLQQQQGPEVLAAKPDDLTNVMAKGRSDSCALTSDFHKSAVVCACAHMGVRAHTHSQKNLTLQRIYYNGLKSLDQ